jgi:hypothetical protein
MKAVTKDDWRELTELEQNQIAEQIVERWRKRGFPHYDFSLDKRINHFGTFQKFDRSHLIKDGIVGQTLHALGLVWTYFPHHWDIKTGKMLTPMEVWESDELFLKAIKSRARWGGFNFTDGKPDMSESYVRKALRTYSGTQRVSNFRPSAAAIIYDTFSQGVVWDMSCGFGGRLLGAIVSSKVDTYIGTDPSEKTYIGLLRLKEDFAYRTKTKVELHKLGSEIFEPEKNSLDLCFTSPPYFNTEKYADEPTQSFIKFDNIEIWNEGFLRQTIKNARYGLKTNGHLILNVANTKTHKTLEIDTIKIAQEEGFVLTTTLQLALSSINRGGHKYEPIFIFRRAK